MTDEYFDHTDTEDPLWIQVARARGCWSPVLVDNLWYCHCPVSAGSPQRGLHSLLLAQLYFPTNFTAWKLLEEITTAGIRLSISDNTIDLYRPLDSTPWRRYTGSLRTLILEAWLDWHNEYLRETD